MSAVPSILLGPLARVGDLGALLAPGRTLTGRVSERHGDHGLLLLAGRVLVAQLPDGIEPGARLRLRVADVDVTRVRLDVVAVSDGPAAAASLPAVQAPPASPVRLPAGAQVQVLEAAGAGGLAPSASVTLRLSSPGLGRVDLRVTSGAVAVHLPDGPPAALARAAAAELAAALGGAQVTVHPRPTSLDHRA